MLFLGQPASYTKKKNYEVHEVLGEGTFGKVVRASWKTHTPVIEVALKASIVLFTLIRRVANCYLRSL